MAGKSRFGVVNKPIFLLGLAGHKMIIRDEAVDMK